MEEQLENLKSACAGLSPEEIEAQVMASQYAEDIGDSGQLARFLCALSQADDTASATPDDEGSPEQAGND